MRYLKALGAGLVGAVLGVMVWILAQTIYIALILVPQLRSAGSGGIGAVSVGIASPGLLLSAAAGFVLAVLRYRRRARLQPAPGGPAA